MMFVLPIFLPLLVVAAALIVIGVPYCLISDIKNLRSRTEQDEKPHQLPEFLREDD
jgi:hypothetical protein